MFRLCKHILFLAGVFIISSSFFNSLYSRDGRIPNLLDYDNRDYHFGFLLGLNKMDFALQPKENLHDLDMSIGLHRFDTLKSVLCYPEYGFNIGIISNLKLGEYFDLRFIPTLSFGERSIVYEGVRENGDWIRRSQSIESTFLDFPLHVKYKSARMTNTRVYVLGGLKYSYDLASIEDQDDPDSDVLARLLKNDLYYELGVGFDYYFFYFKLSTEIKASFGLRNILKDENTLYTNSIQNLNSNIIQLSFLFE